uniref:Potassium channel inwardly rectifying transmembrane domain-containing protein n=1 Tax=Ditylenchus dipsaci TaxID=166011 RepID=A0A915DJP5_9BILA
MRAAHLKSQWRSMATAKAERQQRRANPNNGLSTEIAGGLKRRFSLFFPEKRSFDQPIGGRGADTASDLLSVKMTSKYLHRIRLVIPHILLYMATILYSIFGAIVFHRLELPFETEHLHKHSLAIIEAQVGF